MKPQWYFLNFFLFFWNFLLRVRLERNRTIVFIFSISQRFPLILAWNEATIVFYNFLNFFAICMEFSITHWVGTKRNHNLYFCLFLGHFRPIFAWKEATTVFFLIFCIFIAIFYEFSITHQVGTKRNDNFYFPRFSVYTNELWLERKPQWYF